jgi:hypothetical protein
MAIGCRLILDLETISLETLVRQSVELLEHTLVDTLSYANEVSGV